MSVYNMNNNTAYWITESSFMSPPDVCSNCKQRTQGGWIEPYCPKCGAKMLGIKILESMEDNNE